VNRYHLTPRAAKAADADLRTDTPYRTLHKDNPELLARTERDGKLKRVEDMTAAVVDRHV
jgi:hypothetical protein